MIETKRIVAKALEDGFMAEELARRVKHDTMAQSLPDDAHLAKPFVQPRLRLDGPLATQQLWRNWQGGLVAKDIVPEYVVYNVLDDATADPVEDEYGTWQQDDPDIVGSIAFATAQDDVYVEELYVDPDYRQTQAFMMLVQPVLETGLPVRADFENPKLQAVFQKLVERGKLKESPTQEYKKPEQMMRPWMAGYEQQLEAVEFVEKLIGTQTTSAWKLSGVKLIGVPDNGFGGKGGDNRYPGVYDYRTHTLYVATAGNVSHANLIKHIPEFKGEMTPNGYDYSSKPKLKDLSYGEFYIEDHVDNMDRWHDLYGEIPEDLGDEALRALQSTQREAANVIVEQPYHSNQFAFMYLDGNLYVGKTHRRIINSVLNQEAPKSSQQAVFGWGDKTGEWHDSPPTAWRIDIMSGNFWWQNQEMPEELKQQALEAAKAYARQVDLQGEQDADMSIQHSKTTNYHGSFVYQDGRLAIGHDYHRNLMSQKNMTRQQPFTAGELQDVNGHWYATFWSGDLSAELDVNLEQEALAALSERVGQQVQSFNPHTQEYDPDTGTFVPKQSADVIPGLSIPTGWGWYTSWIYIPEIDQLLITSHQHENHRELLRGYATPEINQAIRDKKYTIVPGLILKNYVVLNDYVDRDTSLYGILSVYSDEFRGQHVLETNAVDMAIQRVKEWAAQNTDWGDLTVIDQRTSRWKLTTQIKEVEHEIVGDIPNFGRPWFYYEPDDTIYVGKGGFHRPLIKQLGVDYAGIGMLGRILLGRVEFYLDQASDLSLEEKLAKVFMDAGYPVQGWGNTSYMSKTAATAFVYDPETDKLYVGDYHRSIIRSSPELKNKMKDLGRYEDGFSTPLVLGWHGLIGWPDSDEDAPETPEQKQRAFDLAAQYFKTTALRVPNRWIKMKDGTIITDADIPHRTWSHREVARYYGINWKDVDSLGLCDLQGNPEGAYDFDVNPQARKFYEYEFGRTDDEAHFFDKTAAVIPIDLGSTTDNLLPYGAPFIYDVQSGDIYLGSRAGYHSELLRHMPDEIRQRFRRHQMGQDIVPGWITETGQPAFQDWINGDVYINGVEPERGLTEEQRDYVRQQLQSINPIAKIANVEYVYTDNENAAYSDRNPFIYDRANDTLYIGVGTHRDLIRAKPELKDSLHHQSDNQFVVGAAGSMIGFYSFDDAMWVHALRLGDERWQEAFVKHPEFARPYELVEQYLNSFKTAYQEWEAGWIYDPKIDHLYTGGHHREILREHGLSLDGHPDYVYGWIEDGEPVVASFEYVNQWNEDDVQETNEQRALSAAYTWWQTTKTARIAEVEGEYRGLRPLIRLIDGTVYEGMQDQTHRGLFRSLWYDGKLKSAEEVADYGLLDGTLDDPDLDPSAFWWAGEDHHPDIDMMMNSKTAAQKPLLFLDVDGVLLSYHQVDNVEYESFDYDFGGGTTYPLIKYKGVEQKIAQLIPHFELVWGTSWRGEANTLREQFGIDVDLAWSDVEGTNKSPELETYADGRPYAWLDDGAWDEETPDHLYVHVSPISGLSDQDVQRCIQWADSLTAIEGNTRTATTTVVRVPTNGQDESGPPLIYDRDNDTLYMGVTDGYHVEILRAHPELKQRLKNEDMQDMREDDIGLYMGRVEDDPNYGIVCDWYLLFDWPDFLTGIGNKAIDIYKQNTRPYRDPIAHSLWDNGVSTSSILYPNTLNITTTQYSSKTLPFPSASVRPDSINELYLQADKQLEDGIDPEMIIRGMIIGMKHEYERQGETMYHEDIEPLIITWLQWHDLLTDEIDPRESTWHLNGHVHRPLAPIHTGTDYPHQTCPSRVPPVDTRKPIFANETTPSFSGQIIPITTEWGTPSPNGQDYLWLIKNGTLYLGVDAGFHKNLAKAIQRLDSSTDDQWKGITAGGYYLRGRAETWGGYEAENVTDAINNWRAQHLANDDPLDFSNEPLSTVEIDNEHTHSSGDLPFGYDIANRTVYVMTKPGFHSELRAWMNENGIDYREGKICFGEFIPPDLLMVYYSSYPPELTAWAKDYFQTNIRLGSSSDFPNGQSYLANDEIPVQWIRLKKPLSMNFGFPFIFTQGKIYIGDQEGATHRELAKTVRLEEAVEDWGYPRLWNHGKDDSVSGLLFPDGSIEFYIEYCDPDHIDEVEQRLQNVDMNSRTAKIAADDIRVFAYLDGELYWGKSTHKPLVRLFKQNGQDPKQAVYGWVNDDTKKAYIGSWGTSELQNEAMYDQAIKAIQTQGYKNVSIVDASLTAKVSRDLYAGDKEYQIEGFNVIVMPVEDDDHTAIIYFPDAKECFIAIGGHHRDIWLTYKDVAERIKNTDERFLAAEITSIGQVKYEFGKGIDYSMEDMTWEESLLHIEKIWNQVAPMYKEAAETPIVQQIDVEPNENGHDAWIYIPETNTLYYGANTHHRQLFEAINYENAGYAGKYDMLTDDSIVGDAQFFYRENDIEIDEWQGRAIPDQVYHLIESLYYSHHESDIEERRWRGSSFSGAEISQEVADTLRVSNLKSLSDHVPNFEDSVQVVSHPLWTIEELSDVNAMGLNGRIAWAADWDQKRIVMGRGMYHRDLFKELYKDKFDHAVNLRNDQNVAAGVIGGVYGNPVFGNQSIGHSALEEILAYLGKESHIANTTGWHVQYVPIENATDPDWETWGSDRWAFVANTEQRIILISPGAFHRPLLRMLNINYVDHGTELNQDNSNFVAGQWYNGEVSIYDSINPYTDEIRNIISQWVENVHDGIDPDQATKLARIQPDSVSWIGNTAKSAIWVWHIPTNSLYFADMFQTYHRTIIRELEPDTKIKDTSDLFLLGEIDLVGPNAEVTDRSGRSGTFPPNIENAVRKAYLESMPKTSKYFNLVPEWEAESRTGGLPFILSIENRLVVSDDPDEHHKDLAKRIGLRPLDIATAGIIYPNQTYTILWGHGDLERDISDELAEIPDSVWDEGYNLGMINPFEGIDDSYQPFAKLVQQW